MHMPYEQTILILDPYTTTLLKKFHFFSLERERETDQKLPRKARNGRLGLREIPLCWAGLLWRWRASLWWLQLIYFMWHQSFIHSLNIFYILGTVLGAWVTSMNRTKFIALTLKSHKSVSEDIGFRSALFPTLCIGSKDKCISHWSEGK